MEAPLPTPATSADWTKAVASWPELANDQEGDCVEAAALHQVQLWTAYASIMETPDDVSATKDYADASGFVPATATTPALNDNGTNMPAFLQRWQTTGIEVEQGQPLHKLDDYAALDPRNVDQVKLAISLFGGCLVGVALPTSAQGESAAGKPWALTTDAPGSWGGHAVLLVRYDADPDNYVWCVTWGGLQALTWDWWLAYGVEAYALLSHSWITAAGTAPSGLTFEQLAAILDRLRPGQLHGSD